MKRNVFRAIAALLICVMSFAAFSACGGQSEPVEDKTDFAFLVFSHTHAIAADQFKIEYYDNLAYELDNAEAAKVTRMNIRGQTKRLTYRFTLCRSMENFLSHFYHDENGNSLVVSDEGRIIAYNYVRVEEPREVLRTPESAEEYIQVAKNYLDDIVSLDGYETKYDFNEKSGLHEVTFNKYADGFKCADNATVHIKPDGTIKKFNSGMLGKMSAGIDSPYNPAIVEEGLLLWLEEVYAEGMKKYENVTIVNINYSLSLDNNNQHGVECYIEFKMENKYEGGTIVSWDTLGVFIQ